ncbi:MAG TPA: hypothetical protein VFH27_01805 [Longimicrobiaceae bacterium]|nr:hypothetical protein [Longimicrobiaceae bacterium]
MSGPKRAAETDPQPKQAPPRVAPADAHARPASLHGDPRAPGPMALTPAQVLHLQRTVGNRATGALLARRTAPARGGQPAADVVQRDAVWKDNNHPNNYMDGFVTALNGVVQAAATAALDPDSLADTDGYITLWKDTAVILRAIADNDIDTGDPDEVAEAAAARSFGAARYGYAVESLACGESGTLNAALPAGCSYQLQASRGMTRPDIVVRHNVNGEVAWLDITSSGSIGHIDRKTGTGWRAKPYVAEITYPALDPTQVGTSNLSVGERVARRNAIKRRIRQWDALVGAQTRTFRTAWDDQEGASKNKQGKQQTAREIIAGMLGVTDVTPQVTKSLIRAFSLSVKDYGFDAGGTKAEGESILRTTFGV